MKGRDEDREKVRGEEMGEESWGNERRIKRGVRGEEMGEERKRGEGKVKGEEI